jgi:endonuclease/exonuclease/phosphatase family metal-dependent hydrolase
VKIRLLTYNILKGGQEREAQIVEVIRSVAPDVVVVQEVLDVEPFWQIAAGLGMSPYLAQSQGRLPLRVGMLSRLPVLDFRTLRL